MRPGTVDVCNEQNEQQNEQKCKCKCISNPHSATLWVVYMSEVADKAGRRIQNVGVVRGELSLLCIWPEKKLTVYKEMASMTAAVAVTKK